MSIADFGAVLGLLVVLGCLGIFVYNRYMKQ